MRAVRCVSNKREPLHGDDDYGLNLCNRRQQNIFIFKAVNGMLPEYLSDLFVLRNNVNGLRGAKVWISLPDELRQRQFLRIDYMDAVRELHL